VAGDRVITSFTQSAFRRFSDIFLLPVDLQGTPLRASGSPNLEIALPQGVTPGHQRASLDLLAELNRSQADTRLTLLRLLGLDHAKRTYLHGGRFKQLSEFGGQVITELIA
jgi:hypothetical protein